MAGIGEYEVSPETPLCCDPFKFKDCDYLVKDKYCKAFVKPEYCGACESCC